MVESAANRMLVSALKKKPLSLTLSNKGLTYLPAGIGRITSVKSLDLKNNNLKDLPESFSNLKELKFINLGNNDFTEISSSLADIQGLETLHLFNNKLSELNPVVFGNLQHLVSLNLNQNLLVELPSSINRLSYLQHLSLNQNNLQHLPDEICHLSQLQELNINNNCIKSLPKDIAYLRKLQILQARKNKIEKIPEGIVQCVELEVLDVAGNYIQSFPVQLCKLKLKELYCEENKLFLNEPVYAIQEREVLSLKEITARFVLRFSKSPRSSMVKSKLKKFPEVENLLNDGLDCALCRNPFLNTWLECVRFVDSKKVLKTKNNAGTIPVRGLLCSYECFNQARHDFYGIAQAMEQNAET